MTVSVTAVNSSAALPVTMPKVSLPTVATAMSSAGLAPETNLNDANARNTRPRLTLRIVMLWAVRKVVSRSSMALATARGETVDTEGRAVIVDMWVPLEGGAVEL